MIKIIYVHVTQKQKQSRKGGHRKDRQNTYTHTPVQKVSQENEGARLCEELSDVYTQRSDECVTVDLHAFRG